MLDYRLPQIIQECRLPPLAEKWPHDKKRKPPISEKPEKKDKDAEFEITTRKIIEKATQEILRNVKRWYN